jgi:hypothetical protein
MVVDDITAALAVLRQVCDASGCDPLLPLTRTSGRASVLPAIGKDACPLL